MLSKSAALLASLSLAASPALAQPSAQPLSLQPTLQRAAAPMQGSQRLEGDHVVPIVILVILIGGILLAAHVFNNGPPRSP
jgi:hypothetical protein